MESGTKACSEEEKEERGNNVEDTIPNREEESEDSERESDDDHADLDDEETAWDVLESQCKGYSYDEKCNNIIYLI
jgi:hypothetical protein